MISVARRVVRTRKADVYGADVSRSDVNMQTGNHEGQTCTVRKNVTVEYEKPSPWKKIRNLGRHDDVESITGDVAVVNAKEIHGPWPVIFKGRRQKKIQAKRDVTIFVESHKKRGGSK